MAATHKASVIARQLAEELKLRLGLAVTVGVDGSQNVTIQIGTGAAASQSAFIRLQTVETIQTNGIGQAQRVFTPHVAQVVVEAGVAAGTLVITPANFAKIIADVTKIGMRTDLYVGTNAAAADAAQIVPAKLVASYDDLWHPLTSSM